MYNDNEFGISFVKQAIKVFETGEDKSIIDIVEARTFSYPVEPGYSDGRGIRF